MHAVIAQFQHFFERGAAQPVSQQEKVEKGRLTHAGMADVGVRAQGEPVLALRFIMTARVVDEAEAFAQGFGQLLDPANVMVGMGEQVQVNSGIVFQCLFQRGREFFPAVAF